MLLHLKLVLSENNLSYAKLLLQNLFEIFNILIVIKGKLSIFIFSHSKKKSLFFTLKILLNLI